VNSTKTSPTPSLAVGFTTTLNDEYITETEKCKKIEDCMHNPFQDPPFPYQKFNIESNSWFNEPSGHGGYIGIIWIPVYREIRSSWSLTLKFSYPIDQVKTWTFLPSQQFPTRENTTVTFHPRSYNTNLKEKEMLEIRFMCEYHQDVTTLKNGINVPEPQSANFLGQTYKSSTNNGLISKILWQVLPLAPTVLLPTNSRAMENKLFQSREMVF